MIDMSDLVPINHNPFDPNSMAPTPPAPDPSAAAAAPAAAPDPSAAAPAPPSAMGLLSQGNIGGAIGAAGSSPMVQQGLKQLAAPQAAPMGGGQGTQGQQAMQVPQLHTNQGQIAQMAPGMMAQIAAAQRRPMGMLGKPTGYGMGYG